MTKKKKKRNQFDLLRRVWKVGSRKLRREPLPQNKRLVPSGAAVNVAFDERDGSPRACLAFVRQRQPDCITSKFLAYAKLGLPLHDVPRWTLSAPRSSHEISLFFHLLRSFYASVGSIGPSFNWSPRSITSTIVPSANKFVLCAKHVVFARVIVLFYEFLKTIPSRAWEILR